MTVNHQPDPTAGASGSIGPAPADHAGPAPDRLDDSPLPTYELGARGLVVLETTADDVIVRGGDGTAVRVVSPRARDDLEVEATSGRLSLRTRRVGTFGFFGVRIGGWGFGAAESGATVEIEVPRDARLDISTASGDVAVRDVAGGARIRTAAGDVTARGVAGDLVFRAASGRLEAIGCGPLRLDAHTMSGEVTIDTPRIESTKVHTVSGDVAISTAFGADGPHVIETTSGSVNLSVAGGLTLEVRTVSGDVDIAHPARSGGLGRRDPVVLGDGRARMAVRTLSGDMKIRGGRSEADPGPATTGPVAAAADTTEATGPSTTASNDTDVTQPVLTAVNATNAGEAGISAPRCPSPRALPAATPWPCSRRSPAARSTSMKPNDSWRP